MTSRVLLAAGLLVGVAASAAAQAPLRLQISDGRVTLHAENVPVRTILAEWARVGGTTILNGDRVAGAPLTLELEGVPERRALDIVLRSVSGYVVAARQPGKSGASIYDRIMILPTSVAPRNPAPTPAVAGGHQASSARGCHDPTIRTTTTIRPRKATTAFRSRGRCRFRVLLSEASRCRCRVIHRSPSCRTTSRRSSHRRSSARQQIRLGCRQELRLGLA